MTESSLSSPPSMSTRQRRHPLEHTLQWSPAQDTTPHETKKQQPPDPGTSRYRSSPTFAAKRRKSLHAVRVWVFVLLAVATALVVLMIGEKSSSSQPVAMKKNNAPHPPTAVPTIATNMQPQPATKSQTETPRDMVGATDDAFSIANIDAERNYPLASLGYQSATDFYQRGMRQRSKPFSRTDFDVEVTCETPVQLENVPEWKTRAPYVLILGAQKGGSTAMAYYLYNHPQFIYLPSKELHFFDDDMDAWSTLKNLNGSEVLDTYQTESMSQDYNMTQFQKQQAIQPAYIMDATPNYLFASDRVPQRVFCACGPWVKLLVFLRNPIDRAWSHYHMQHNTDSVGNLTKLLSFEKYIEMDKKVLKEAGVLPPENVEGHMHFGSAEEQKAWKTYTRLGINSPLGRGLYSIQLRQWFQTLKQFGKPKSHLVVFESEQMKVHSKIIYQQVLEFLELPPYEMSNFEPVHETKYGDNTKMKPETREMLQEFFRPYNQQLKDLLGSEWDGIWEDSIQT